MLGNCPQRQLAAKLYFYRVAGIKLMTRLLLINKLFYPVYGGVETVVAQIAEGIAASENFRVTVLAGNEKPSFVNKHYRWKQAEIIKAASFGLIYNTALSIKYPFALHSLIKEHDVFHFHVPNPLGEIAFFLNKIPAHKKVIVSVHADISQTKRKAYGSMYNFFLRKLLDRADIITTMSSQNKEGFPVLKPWLHKCVIVPLAYDARHILQVNKEDIAAFQKKHAMYNTKKTVLFVGRLSEDKGISFLIKAMAEMPNIQLLIAGDGNLKNSLVRQAKESTNKSIFFTGYIDSHDMACAYSIADIFVLPSVSETFGIVQAEAMRFGVPVINTALNTGVNFVSIHNETGLTVPPANPQALATAISTIINDDALRKRLSANALQRSALFTPGRMVDTFKDLYKTWQP